MHTATLEELATALVTFLRNFHLDTTFKNNIIRLFGITETYRQQAECLFGVGTVNFMIQICQYALDNLPIKLIVRKLHEAAIDSSCILQYRAFLVDHKLFVLMPERLVYEHSRKSFCCGLFFRTGK